MRTGHERAIAQAALSQIELVTTSQLIARTLAKPIVRK